MRKLCVLIAVAAAAIAAFWGAGASAKDASGAPVLDVRALQSVEAEAARDARDSIVVLSGKINHFGNPDYHAIVEGVAVWIAELPESKGLGVKSGEDGWWTMKALKREGIPAEISFVYEKKDWITTKSNAITLEDEDITDLSIQYIDPELFKTAMKPMVEAMIRGNAPDGESVEFRNAVVGTIGKAWASIHDDRLPHGDPGAVSQPMRGAIGPIYFDRNVMPDPTLSETSVDGGITWINAAAGEHVVGATKEGVKYENVKFIIGPNDAEEGIMLYIASPPHSIQGDNESAPGKP